MMSSGRAQGKGVRSSGLTSMGESMSGAASVLMAAVFAAPGTVALAAPAGATALAGEVGFSKGSYSIKGATQYFKCAQMCFTENML